MRTSLARFAQQTASSSSEGRGMASTPGAVGPRSDIDGKSPFKRQKSSREAVDGDLFTIPVSVPSLLLSASTAVGDSGLVSRLALNTSSATDRISGAVRTVSDALSTAVVSMKANAQRECASICKRLEWQCEECDRNKSMLESWARQMMLDASTVDEEGCEASLRTAAQVLDEMAVLTQSAGVMCVGEAGPVSKVLSGMSSVQLGVASEHSVTSCPRYLKRCEANAVTVSCHDALGEVVKTVTPGDVTIGWSDSTVEGWSVCGPPTVGNGVVHVYILPTEEAECNVTLCVVIDCTRFHIPLSAGSAITGSCIRTVQMQGASANSGNYSGLAVSHDGTLFAVSNFGWHCVSVYSTLDGSLVNIFGSYGNGRGLFDCPLKMCFSPLTGNLLIADSDNFSVQEVTVTGDHVRTIGDGVVNDGIVGVSANIDLIAVSSHCLLGNIWLFSITTGALIRSFGVSGHAEGQLSISTGIRLTSDGHHIYIAESGNDRVSLFTILGDFVRCFGKGVLDCPLDVDIATNGDVVVADTRNDLIRVFSADGSTLVRSFGRNSGGTREFKSPTALAIHRGALVVLCRGSPNILYLK